MLKKLRFEESGLTRSEYRTLTKLNTPTKIQNFLNHLKFDFNPGDKINRSVRGTLKSRKTDCAGGAILAAAALWLQGKPPLLLDLKAKNPDVDHVAALFSIKDRLVSGGKEYWGAISKTNHTALRYREPVYRDVRELVMSYFHEYFLPNGEKTLRAYSQPFNLSKYGTKWLTHGEKLLDIIYYLDHSPHTKILSNSQIKRLRRADKIERKALELSE